MSSASDYSYYYVISTETGSFATSNHPILYGSTRRQMFWNGYKCVWEFAPSPLPLPTLPEETDDDEVSELTLMEQG